MNKNKFGKNFDDEEEAYGNSKYKSQTSASSNRPKISTPTNQTTKQPLTRHKDSDKDNYDEFENYHTHATMSNNRSANSRATKSASQKHYDHDDDNINWKLTKDRFSPKMNKSRLDDDDDDDIPYASIKESSKGYHQREKIDRPRTSYGRKPIGNEPGPGSNTKSRMIAKRDDINDASFQVKAIKKDIVKLRLNSNSDDDFDAAMKDDTRNKYSASVKAKNLKNNSDDDDIKYKPQKVTSHDKNDYVQQETYNSKYSSHKQKTDRYGYDDEDKWTPKKGSSSRGTNFNVQTEYDSRTVTTTTRPKSSIKPIRNDDSDEENNYAHMKRDKERGRLYSDDEQSVHRSSNSRNQLQKSHNEQDKSTRIRKYDDHDERPIHGVAKAKPYKDDDEYKRPMTGSKAKEKIRELREKNDWSDDDDRTDGHRKPNRTTDHERTKYDHLLRNDVMRNKSSASSHMSKSHRDNRSDDDDNDFFFDNAAKKPDERPKSSGKAKPKSDSDYESDNKHNSHLKSHSSKNQANTRVNRANDHTDDEFSNYSKLNKNKISSNNNNTASSQQRHNHYHQHSDKDDSDMDRKPVATTKGSGSKFTYKKNPTITATHIDDSDDGDRKVSRSKITTPGHVYKSKTNSRKSDESDF